MHLKYEQKVEDALSKSLELSKKDAERFPNEKGKILSCGNICALSEIYTLFDPDIYFNYIMSVESNLRRLRKEMTYIFKIHLLVALDNEDVNRNVHLGHLSRLFTLTKKYDIDGEHSQFFKAFFAFPDISCNLLLKLPKLSAKMLASLNDYKNFKNEHKWPCYIGMLPTGKKYGGFVKAIVQLIFMELREHFPIFLIQSDCIFDRNIGFLRSLYNATSIQQEKRVKFFENLHIKEADCTLWSQNFDRQFPEYAYIHTLFGQVA